MPSSAPDSLLGTDLDGRYHLERLSSEEMLGRVYVARDRDKDELVQVKVLHPHLTDDAEKFHRFGRELTVTRMVRHPHTVQVLDWGQHGTVHYLVLEYLTAHTLAAELDDARVAPERAAAIAAQVAQAIGAAHQENIVHRNLSPHNVLLLDNVKAGGVFVKVRDFGLSRLEKFEEDTTSLTQAGARIGNVHYMAPEYIDDNRVHPKGDLYALGVLLYHMVIGFPPFEGQAGEVLSMHVVDDPPRPTEADPALPAWCDEVVQALMAKKPEDRPGAYQVVQMLEAGVGHALDDPALLGLDDDGGVVKPSRAPYVLAAAAALGLAAGALLLAVAVVIGAGWYLWTRAPEVAVAPDAPVEEGLQPMPDATPPDPAPTPGDAEAPAPSADAPAPSPRSRPTSRPSPRPAPKPDAPPAEPPPAATATLRVRANRRVLVYVDDAAVGYTPLDHPVGAGPHEVAALVPGQPASRQERTVDVSGEGQTVDFQF